uniref:Elicitin n=1 Tax=Globisporangium ultimum (strain ATCC 200006 / CBS 805.95 / DAOM BR144) TaxID=431595 RepID=K3WTU1_GLOUD
MSPKWTLITLAVLAGAVTNAEDQCATASGEVTKLASTGLLGSGTSYAKCRAATNNSFGFVPISGTPGPELLATMCAVSECSLSMSELLAKSLTLTDCITVNSLTKNSINIYRFLRDYSTACSQFTPAPTQVTPAPTPATPTPTPATTPAIPAPAATPGPTPGTPDSPAPTVTSAPTASPEPTLPKPAC